MFGPLKNCQTVAAAVFEILEAAALYTVAPFTFTKTVPVVPATAAPPPGVPA